MSSSEESPPEAGAPDGTVLRDRTRLTKRLNTVMNRFADRDDLLVLCLWREPEEGEAPAWYDSSCNRVFLNAHVGLRGAPPGRVNPLTRAGRRRHPEIIGLLAHEASHAHSTDMTEEAQEFHRQVHDEDPLLAEVMTLLEEPRIEFRQVQRRPHDRYYLRAQSVMIDLAPFSVDASAERPSLDRWKAATVAVLVCGRVEAGILRPYDADHLLPSLVDALGAGTLASLREVLRTVVRVEDGDLAGLLECAREWVQVVGRPPRDESARRVALPLFGCGGPEEDSEWANAPHEEVLSEEVGEGAERDKGDGAGLGVLTDLGAALEGLAYEVATEIADDVAALEASEAAQAASGEAAEARKKDAKEAVREEKAAESVFSSRGTSEHRALRGTRAPTSDERRMAQEAGKALKRAQVRDRSVAKWSSEAPPGRLDGRQAMLGAAQRSMGTIVTARPFQQKRSRHAPEPPITLGLLADYSGSMGWAAGALSSVTWVFAHAMTHVTGTMASALFADKVIPLSRPREVPAEVQEYAANSGGHSFGRAHQAMNGALHLTRGRGVRLLVVISDAHYGGGKNQDDLERSLRHLRRAGVIVLWVGLLLNTHFPADAVPVPLSPMAAVTEDSELAEYMVSTITDALVDALNTYR